MLKSLFIFGHRTNSIQLISMNKEYDILQDLTVDFLFLMPFVKIVQSFTGVILQKCRSVYLYEIGTNITRIGNFT